MRPQDRRTLELLQAFLLNGAVRVRTSAGDVRAACDLAGVPVALGLDSRIVLESVFLLDGGSVARVCHAVVEPRVFPLAWSVHQANTEAALEPLSSVKARAEWFSKRARWGSRALALGSGGFGATEAWKAFDAWRTVAEAVALRYALCAVVGLAGTLAFTVLRSSVGRLIWKFIFSPKQSPEGERKS